MSRSVALITGIAGGLAQLVGEELAGHGYEIVGVDYRSEPQLGYPATTYQANYNKTKIEDIVRRHKPSLVLHLGRVGNLKEQLGKRFDLNVVGSRKVMDLAARYGARRLVVLSTYHIYGAHPHNHVPIFEDEPLRAGTGFPQIADAIQLDNQAVMWMHSHAECRTAILRPCNVVGPDLRNAISNYLRADPVAVVLGFDPMTQLIHQEDLVEVLVRVALGRATGVFNVAGDGAIPLREALKVRGGRQVPVPSLLAMGALKVAQLVGAAFPPYLVNFLKYPCIISDAAIRETFGWEPKIGQREAVASTIRGARRTSSPRGSR